MYVDLLVTENVTEEVPRQPMKVLDRVPVGQKSNVYAVVNNENFADVARVGRVSSTTTAEPGQLDTRLWLRVTDRRTDRITTPTTALAYARAVKMVSGKRTYVPLEPQPNCKDLYTASVLCYSGG